MRRRVVECRELRVVQVECRALVAALTAAGVPAERVHRGGPGIAEADGVSGRTPVAGPRWPPV